MNELNRHKRSDAIKWVIVFALIAVLLAGMIASIVLLSPDKDAGEEGDPSEEKTVNDFEAEMHNSEYVALSLASASTLAADGAVSKTLTATINPQNASNNKVDWGIKWSNSSKTETVTDYVTVTPTYDGSTEATVTCLKPFGSEQIIITVTTREGGYSATCVVSFAGRATTIAITSSASLSNNSGRGDYYVLPSSKSTAFTVNLGNAWDSVGSYKLSAEIKAVGSLYFYDSFSDAFGGSTKTNIHEVSLADMVNTLKISASVSGNTVTVTTGKPLDSFYYTAAEPDNDAGGTWYRESLAWYEDWMADFANYPEEYKTAGTSNLNKIDSCYFELKVTDSVSGLSSSVRFWVGTGVNSVSLSAKELVF